MKRENINKIFSLLAANNPNPKTELNYTNPYTLLVAVILSAQSTDAGVNKATKSLFLEHDTPEKILALGEDGLKSYIKTIGLFNNKAKNIIKMSQMLTQDFNSSVPDRLEDLVKLAGVGRKTANVILSTLFGKHAMAVDTHVARVSNRLGFTAESSPEKIEARLMKIIPKKWLFHAHHWLVLHGRYVCTARKPKCAECIIRNHCKYFKTIN